MSSNQGMTRRQLIRNLGAAAALGASSRLAAEPAPQSKNDRPRVLALIGDRYHNADYIRVALGRLFGELNLAVDFTINYDQISADFLRPYRLFVTLRDGMIWPEGYLEPNDYEYSHDLENANPWPTEKPVGWMTEEQGKAIADFVSAGNGLYAFHNSSHISLYSKSFREVMGGVYIDHPPLRPFKVRVVNHEHPVTRGVSDFMVNDEQHFVTYDKDPKYVILRSENVDGLVEIAPGEDNHGRGGKNLGTEAIAGWAYDFGKGRVVFTAVGHTLHALWQPDYVKLQKNAVRWLLKMEKS